MVKLDTPKLIGLKTIIIEDEIPAANRLEKMLLECRPSIEILEVLDTVEDAKEWLQTNPSPDLIFSDIQLADGISFEIYDDIQVDCPIIFTTAYDQYALKAFELNSVDYLLKPYSKDQLEKALSKYEGLHKQNTLQGLNLSALLDIAGGGKPIYKQRFLISKADVYVPVTTDEIAYIYTEDKAVLIKTHGGKNFFLNYSLDELEGQLDPDHFFRLNRQFIVSIPSIEKIAQYFNGKLKVDLKPTPDAEVIVSRAKTPLFKAWLER